VEFIGVAVVGAKNEALFLGRVPHVRPSVHGPKKTGRSPSQRFCYVVKRLPPRARVLARGVKALEESVFGPCTLGRTWGTRPEPMTVVGKSNPPELADLISTSLLSTSPAVTAEPQK
jgi:hypothetical protein